MLRVTARDPLHIADIGVVHADQIIEIPVILLRHLARPVGDKRDSLLPQLVHRAVMGRIADLLAAGGGGVDVEGGGFAALPDQVGEKALGHGASANIAVANE